MTPSSLPHPEDLVIHHPASRIFVISGSDGQPQLLCDTMEEALERAGDFANTQHATVWFTTDHDDVVSLGDARAVRALWGEYAELAALRLTRAQARRILGVDDATCERLLDSLVKAELLMCTDDGRYTRHARAGRCRRMRTFKAPARQRVTAARQVAS